MNRMKETLRHLSWASAMLMKKAADGLPQKRFHQIILSLVVVLAFMPAVNVQAFTILTQSETYTDGMTQVFTYNGYSYQVTYTNLKGITKVNLSIIASEIDLEDQNNNANNVFTLFKNNTSAETTANAITTSDLPKNIGTSISCYRSAIANDGNNPVVTIECVHLVKFDANGGSGTMNTMAYDATAKNLTQNSFTRTGYTFSGWATTATGTKAYDDKASYIATGDVTLYAVWTANQYAVTLNNQSATTAGTTSVTATYDAAMPTPLTLPTKTGYTFGGYYSGTNGSGTLYYNADGTSATTWNIAAATTLYAMWTIIPYTITYTLDGGTNASGNPTTYNVESNTITLSAPTKTGYTFTGWTETDITTPTTSVTIAKGSTGDRAYTANWTINSYTVTFNANGGSDVASQTLTYGDKVIQPAQQTRTGYTFGGWYASSNFSGSAFDFSTIVASDVTLYAKWTIIPYTITYTLDGGTNASNNPATYNVESNITLSAPTKIGYTFTGWTGTDLSAATITVTIPKGSTGDRNYTATWTITIYTITFNANGGTDVASQTLTYGDKVTQPAQQTRTGYTFGGWYASSDFSGSACDFNTIVESDVTLHAKWIPYTYTIRFHSNDGTDNTVTQTINYGEETALTSNTFTKAGLGISKWTTAADGTGTSYIDGQKVLNLSSTDGEVIDLYAQWQNGVNYVNVTVSGGKVSTSAALCTSYQTVTSSTSAMSDGWYVVNSNENVSGSITISGTVNLILCDGYTLTVTDGIRCLEGSTLNIYGQSNNTGTLKASATTQEVSGIGGEGNQIPDAITINGGTVTAQGALLGAGIGGSYTINHITINGGKVTATGGDYCSGIGAGHYHLSGTITINGGNVTATGGIQGGAGIGTGKISLSENLNPDGAIVINGGIINAKGTDGGAGIGGGKYYNVPSVTINGGTITASGTTGIGDGGHFNEGYQYKNTSLVITGGNIKATTNVTPTNGTTYGSQAVNGITKTSLEDAISLTKRETAYTYNLTDVKAIDGNYYIWLPFYSVTWKNMNGTILKETDHCYGETISNYDGATPTLDMKGFTGTFKDWSPTFTNGATITSNVVYTATYDLTLSLPTETINGATYYEISKQEDWDAFSTAVNVISPSTNGIMTADVDLGTDQTMVGTSSSPYAGIFDGNGKRNSPLPPGRKYFSKASSLGTNIAPISANVQ